MGLLHSRTYAALSLCGMCVLPARAAAGTSSTVSLTPPGLTDARQTSGPPTELLAVPHWEVPFHQIDTGPSGRFRELSGHAIVRPEGSLALRLGVNAFTPAAECDPLSQCPSQINGDAQHRADDYVIEGDPAVEFLDVSVNLVLTGRVQVEAINPNSQR